MKKNRSLRWSFFMVCLAISLTIVSCKAKKVVIPEVVTASKGISTNEIIASHYATKKDFSTLYIKSSVAYTDDKQSQNVSAEIKIKKDEKILISVRFLGITMAKALITPTEVKYYEKINGKYFEGNFAGLSQWLGTDLDFQKFQSMLVGQAFDDLHKETYQMTIADQLYKLENTTDLNANKAFYIDSDQFLLKRQSIIQPSTGRMLQVSYPNHKEFSEAIVPLNIDIEAIQHQEKTNINIVYNAFTINEELSFPYDVPDGYERIFID